MGSSSTPAVVGFWYYIGAHLALCHGLDKFTKIRFGDKVVWSGAVTSTSSISINQRDIFGGEEREGGVAGAIDLIMGSKTEAVNSYLASVLPSASPMPAFRGKACIVLKDLAVSANNPNLRPVNVEGFRQPCKGWYPAKEAPGTTGGVNPAHIIRECLTDPTWGMGYAEADLDDASFRAAADTLYAEAFGMSLLWQSAGALLDFITTVVQHIQASLYVDPYNGLFVLKLVRDDYDPATVPILDESNLIDVDSYERTGVSELVNQVTVVWYETLNDIQRVVTVHNTAVRELQGGVVATTLEFPGIADAALANKVAARELRKLSTSVSRAVLRAGRAAATLMIGDVFKLTWPDLGIDQVLMRVGKIEHGNLSTGELRIHCVEDIFSSGEAVYGPPPDTLWISPINDPAPCPRRRVTEAPYILVERSVNESPALLSEIDPMTGFLTCQGEAPSGDAFSYKLYTTASGGTYAFQSTCIFCPTALITDALAPELTTVLNLSGIDLLAQVQTGTYAYIDDECVAVTAVTSSTVTVRRGILDTVPAAHPVNSRIWFAENNEGKDQTQWASGVVVSAKALPTTGKGTLDIALAPADSLAITRRWYRPYPPGNLKVNNLRWPAGALAGDLALTWSHRDRTTQISYYAAQDEGNFGPEAGVTYTIRVYRAAGTLARTVTAVAGTAWTYTAAMEAADAPGLSITFKIVSDRVGLESWQAAEVTAHR